MYSVSSNMKSINYVGEGIIKMHPEINFSCSSFKVFQISSWFIWGIRCDVLVHSPCKSWHSLRYVSSSNQFVPRPCFENVESNAIRPVRRFLSRSAQLTRQCMRFDAKKRSIFIPNLLLFSSLESLLGVHNLWLCGNYQCSWWDPWTLHWIFIHQFSQHSFGSCSYILANFESKPCSL